MHTFRKFLFENTLILEKDHRQKIIKFGIPEDVANWLHEFNDKYSIWFANEFIKNPEFERAANKLTWANTKAHQMQQILDWVTGQGNINIKQYDWNSALQAAEEWHQSLTTRNIENQERNEILKTYGDGFYWVDLDSTYSCEESGSMGHCGRTNRGDTLWSLRKYDPATNTIETFVTMAVSPSDGQWHQAKGKHNSKPKMEYVPYIVDIFMDNDIFEYESEYDSRNDFSVEDFMMYLQENPGKYPNEEEALETLKDSSIEAKAEKLFKEYEDSYSSIDVSWSTEENYIWADGRFTISIDNTDFPELNYIIPYARPGAWEDKKQRGRNQELLETIDKALSNLDVYTSDNWAYGDPYELNEEFPYLTITINVDTEMQEHDINDFENFLEEMYELDKKVSEDDFEEEFIEKWKEQLENYFIIDEDEPAPQIDDPRQMKFKFGDGFNEAVNAILGLDLEEYGVLLEALAGMAGSSHDKQLRKLERQERIRKKKDKEYVQQNIKHGVANEEAARENLNRTKAFPWILDYADPNTWERNNNAVDALIHYKKGSKIPLPRTLTVQIKHLTGDNITLNVIQPWLRDKINNRMNGRDIKKTPDKYIIITRDGKYALEIEGKDLETARNDIFDRFIYNEYKRPEEPKKSPSKYGFAEVIEDKRRKADAIHEGPLEKLLVKINPSTIKYTSYEIKPEAEPEEVKKPVEEPVVPTGPTEDLDPEMKQELLDFAADQIKTWDKKRTMALKVKGAGYIQEVNKAKENIKMWEDRIELINLGDSKTINMVIKEM